MPGPASLGAAHATRTRGEAHLQQLRGCAARSASERTFNRHGKPLASNRKTWNACVNPRAAESSCHSAGARQKPSPLRTAQTPRLKEAP
eukprot:3236398-Alexandrium_andersonii.AAC.2